MLQKHQLKRKRFLKTFNLIFDPLLETSWQLSLGLKYFAIKFRLKHINYFYFVFENLKIIIFICALYFKLLF